MKDNQDRRYFLSSSNIKSKVKLPNYIVKHSDSEKILDTYFNRKFILVCISFIPIAYADL